MAATFPRLTLVDQTNTSENLRFALGAKSIASVCRKPKEDAHPFKPQKRNEMR